MFVALIVGFYLGLKKVEYEEVEIDVLKEGALYIQEITNENEYVMSESYPYLSCYADRITIRPTGNKENFYSLIEKHNITYIYVDDAELGNPSYLLMGNHQN